MILGNPITLGGGGAKVFAVIGVTYHAGSVCTCSDGTKTLELKNTTGQGFFLIPYAGTWTVTATDGTNTKSESIEITSDGQTELIQLDFLIIYDNGNYKGNSWEKYSFGSDNTYEHVNTDYMSPSELKLQSDTSIIGFKNSCVVTNESFDLTKITKLYLSPKELTCNRGSYLYFFVVKEGTPGTMWDRRVVTKTFGTSVNNIELDVSASSGFYHVGIGISFPFNDSINAVLYPKRIWGET